MKKKIIITKDKLQHEIQSQIDQVKNTIKT